MQAKYPVCKPLTLAVALGLVHLANAQAADPAVAPADTSAAQPAAAPAAPVAPSQAERSAGPNLDAIVVTGTSLKSTVMQSSLSISTLGDEQIEKVGATNATELLAAVPGIHTESSGGEGNANVTVRGVPISAGGARYVQFQEDGLPIQLFGDNDFGTPDEWLRVDYNIDRVEVVRGGSASTLASNAPGGIINFISKTGEEQGGAVGLSLGVDFHEQRYDFDYGGKLSDKTRFHVGGFFREGEGPRPSGIQAENGGQLKGNVTHDFDNGFVRLNFKLLDDKTPTYLPVPVSVKGGTISQINGIDPRTAFFLGPNLPYDTNLNKSGGLSTTSTADGLHVTTTSIGGQAHFDLSNGLSVDDNLRHSSNGGRFIGLYPGGALTGGPTFGGVIFNTSLDDMNNTFNDLRISKKISFGDVHSSITGGLFSANQTVGETWDWNNYSVQSVNSNPLAVQTGTGTSTFGGCCIRSFNVEYTNRSPYLSFNAESGPITVDMSVRKDDQHAAGYILVNNPTGANAGVNLDGNPLGQPRPAGVVSPVVNYDVSHNSYSAGINYQLDRDLAVFARISDGVSFIGDRLLNNASAPVDGSAPVGFGEVKQDELGAKYRSGGYSVFLTLFHARTDESNFDLTAGSAQFTRNSYDAKGVELETGYRYNDFHISGGATLTNSHITADPTAPGNVGHTPQRLAHLIYQLAPGYTLGDFDIGAQVVGTTSSYADDGNTFTMPAYTTVNAHVYYQYDERTRMSLAVNNLFNTLGYTEVDGVPSGNGFASARSINGRTIRASLRYSF